MTSVKTAGDRRLTMCHDLVHKPQGKYKQGTNDGLQIDDFSPDCRRHAAEVEQLTMWQLQVHKPCHMTSFTKLKII